MTTHPQRSGAVLLLSLLMMSAIIASTIGVSVLITSDFGQTRSTEQFVRATLAADAGIERSLAIIQAGRAAATLDDTVALTGATLDNTAIAGFDATTSVVTSGLSAVAIAGAGSPPPPLSIKRNQAITFDVLKNGATVPARLNIHSATNQGRLEIAWTVINRAGTAGQGLTSPPLDGTAYSGASTAIIDLLNVYSEGSNSPVPFDGNSTLGYRISITPKDADVTNLEIQPTDSGGTTNLPLFSTVQLTSTGRSGEAVAAKQVTTLWQRPSSPVFSYVLFTEGDIRPEP